MGEKFPYEKACPDCFYRINTLYEAEIVEELGPRAAVCTPMSFEKACGKKRCELEGAVALSSVKLNMREEK